MIKAADRIVLLQSVDESVARRFVPWIQKLDLGVVAVPLRSAADAVEWFAREDRPVHLAVLSATALLDARLRDFWSSRQGGALPIVGLVPGDWLPSFDRGKATLPFPDSAVALPAQTAWLAEKLRLRPQPDVVFFWDPFDRYPDRPPPYLEGLGVSRIRRSRLLSDLAREDRARLDGVVAELGASSPGAPIEWSEWKEATAVLGVPAVAVLGASFASSVRDFQAVARWLGPSLWNCDAPAEWDARRTDLRQAIERGQKIAAFVLEADVFLARGKAVYAIQILEHAVGLHPSAAPLWDKLADALAAEGRDPIESLRRAWRVEAGNRRRWARLIDAYQLAGRRSEMLTVLREVVERFPWDGEFRRQLAEQFRDRGDSAAYRVESGRARLLGLAA